ncbi:hypothetical protein V6N11_071909 [Hibiscus sabdariffa]|uniref:PB1-like domain-containing protein n=1 Tax=Hibiscus sabdariffa TaxID=183260 RepID=A0ABR2U1G6_9ROSI
MYRSDGYYMYCHVGGKFVRDPFVRYEGDEVVKLKEDPDTISYFEVRKIVENLLNFSSSQILYFHEPFSCCLQDNLRLLWDDTSTTIMLNYWMKYGFIDVYVEHKVGTPIVVDNILLIHVVEGSNEFRGDVVGDDVTEGAGDIVGEGDAGEVTSEIVGEAVHEGVHGDVVHEEAGEIATQGASEVLTEGIATDVIYEGVDEGVHEEDVDVVHEGVHEEVVDTIQEGADEGVHEEAVDVVPEEAIDIVLKGADEGVHEEVVDTIQEVADGLMLSMKGIVAATDELQSDVGQQNFYESEDGVYLMKDRYLSYGNDDDELQHTRTTFKSFEGKIVNRGKKHVETDSDSVEDETQPEIRKEIMVEEENVETTCEVDENETDYFDSDDHRSLGSSNNDEHDDDARRKTRFPNTCRRAKNLVSLNLAGNVKEEFVNLWHYANELRAKNPGSTIKITVNGVTIDSPPHVKRERTKQEFEVLEKRTDFSSLEIICRAYNHWVMEIQKFD